MTDDRLHKALEFANYRQTFFNQKQILKNKSEALLSYSTQGGTFKVTQELIAFVGTFVQQEYEEMVLLDTNENLIKIEDLKSALHTFKGVQRRYSVHINNKDLVYIDDYAHHPEEISAIYDSLVESYPNENYLVAFQPHLYTRTRDFIEEFASILSRFHTVLILDIYPARELPIDGVNANWLLSKITSKVKKSVKLMDLDKEIYDCNMKINLTLGAGDIGSKAIKIKKQLLEYAI